MTILFNPTHNKQLPSAQFGMLTTFLVIVFLSGGSSRIDVQSLVVLRPLSVVACGIAVLTLRAEHLRASRLLLIGAAIVFLLCVAHLAPLPAELRSALQGRMTNFGIDEMAGLSNSWRPLTLSPTGGMNAVASLAVPLAVILWGIQLNQRDLFYLLPVLLIMTSLSGILGLLQIIGDAQGPLYFYDITNYGRAVGLFANRNHAAMMLACMFPMLAVHASSRSQNFDSQHIRQLAVLAAVVVLIPLILITGSRGGLITGSFGILAAMALYRPTKGSSQRGGADKGMKIRPLPVVSGAVAVGVVALTLFFSRAEAIDRIFAESGTDGLRADFWKTTLAIAIQYWPLGSGAGSFLEVYQATPTSTRLNFTHVNRAHNDWLETLQAFGLAGILLCLAIVGGFAKRSAQIWRHPKSCQTPVTLARLASAILVIFAIASVADYPLRTPAVMAFAAVVAIWFTASTTSRGSNAPSRAKSRQEATMPS